MQITANINELNDAQRDHLVGFIMTYPRTGGVEVVEADALSMTKPTNIVKDVDQQSQGVSIEEVIDRSLPQGVHSHTSEMQKLAAEQAADLAGADTEVKADDVVAAAFGAPLVPSLVTTDDMMSPAYGVTDSAGLPWDARIHSEGQTKNADGTWRKRRGVDKALVDTVEAGIRKLQELRSSPTTVSADRLTEAMRNALDNIAPPSPPAADRLAEAMSNALDNIAPPPPPAGDPMADYITLVGRASEAASKGLITQGQITEICKAYGLTCLGDLVKRFDLLTAVAEEIDYALGVGGV